MSRTASEENRPDAFCASFVLDTSFAGDSIADSISSLFSTPVHRHNVPLARSMYL
jgi:hypothetical protein